MTERWSTKEISSTVLPNYPLLETPTGRGDPKAIEQSIDPPTAAAQSQCFQSPQWKGSGSIQGRVTLFEALVCGFEYSGFPTDNPLVGGLFTILTFAFAKDFAFLSLKTVLYFEMPWPRFFYLLQCPSVT